MSLQLIFPYLDLNTKYFHLGLQNRNSTDDKVTVETGEATLKWLFYLFKSMEVRKTKGKHSTLTIYTSFLLLLRVDVMTELALLKGRYKERLDKCTNFLNIVSISNPLYSHVQEGMWVICNCFNVKCCYVLLSYLWSTFLILLFSTSWLIFLFLYSGKLYWRFLFFNGV